MALYSATRDGPVKAAVFRWSQEAGVSLAVLDDRWRHRTHSVFEGGARQSNGRPIPREQGQRFMRGRVEYTRATYFSYVDESDTEAAAAG